MNNLALLLATWFGCGYWPKGPGTAGSIGALLVAWPLILWAGWGPWHFVLLAAAMTLPGIWSSTRTARIKNMKDPQIVVIDEVLGQWIALGGASMLNWKQVLAAFVLFRLFDITKPWPVRRLESIPDGTGIVFDDLAAGIYAAATLAALRIVVQF